VRPNKRMKPQVQTTLRSPNDIMAHSGGAMQRLQYGRSMFHNVSLNIFWIPECDANATTAIMCGSPMPQTLAGMTWHATGYTHVYST
jgi:hypothetical protein